MGPIYVNLNRNKRSVVLDLSRREAVDAVLRLCRRADMFVSNVRPAAMQRLGLAHEQVCAVKPDIVYLNLTGYGQDGPYAAKPAVDDVMQAGSGIAGLLATVSEGPPVYVPLGIADRLAGTAAAHAALAALLLRARTGQGQYLEVPMYETVVAAVMGDHLAGSTFEPPSGPMGYTRMLTPHRRPFRTRDGFVGAVIYTENHWRTFMRLIGRSELFETDPRFADAAVRARHYPEIYEFLAEAFLGRTSDAWLACLAANDIPCSKVESLESLLEDPHLAAVGMFNILEHPALGTIREMRVPTRWRGVDLSARRHAPGLGEQTAEVLVEAGFSAAEIRALAASGAAPTLAAQA